MRRLSALVLVFGMAVTLLHGDLDEEERVGRITSNIVCDCGCANLIVRTCGCGRAAEMIEEVRGLLRAGNTETLVYALLEEKYGPSIHAAPKPEGFNLLAWVVPFVALGLGAIAVVVVVRRLKPAALPETAPDREPEVEDKYRRLLENELRE